MKPVFLIEPTIAPSGQKTFTVIAATNEEAMAAENLRRFGNAPSLMDNVVANNLLSRSLAHAAAQTGVFQPQRWMTLEQAHIVVAPPTFKPEEVKKIHLAMAAALQTVLLRNPWELEAVTGQIHTFIQRGQQKHPLFEIQNGELVIDPVFYYALNGLKGMEIPEADDVYTSLLSATQIVQERTREKPKDIPLGVPAFA